MTGRSFSLRFLLAIVTIFCIVAWAMAMPSVATWIATVIMLSVAGAVWGLIRGGRPVRCGAASGVAAVVTLIFCDWAVHVGGYFFHNEPWPYFEDGVVNEVFFYPVAYCVCYWPVGAVMGVIVGFVLQCASSVWKVCKSDYPRSIASPSVSPPE
jgi:hypothetical protein